MDEKGAFNIPAFISSVVLMGLFVFLFPVIQIFLDQGTINFENFAQASLLQSLMIGMIILIAVLIAFHPFQESQEASIANLRGPY